MNICGIICEYNPFHNGHRYQIEQARAAGATHIAAVMSGSFLQRGDIACFSKWDRAKAALLSGCDLVIELPTVYALSSAERFASGAASVFEAMGCVNTLHFGSESGSIDELMAVAKLCELLDGSERLKKRLKSGENHAAARQALVEQELGPQAGQVLRSPNNTLGVEYLKALIRSGSAITPQTVRRHGAEHDACGQSGEFASATYLRQLLEQGRTGEFLSCVPESAWPVYQQRLRDEENKINRDALETAVLYSLRMREKEDFFELPDVTEGLQNRLYQASRQAGSLLEFYALTKTRRYTLSRLRRIALCSLLGITKEDTVLSPACLRVLGMNRRGMEILKRMRDTAKLPFGTAFAKLCEAGGRIMEVDRRATDVYALCRKNRGPCGEDFTTPSVVLED